MDDTRIEQANKIIRRYSYYGAAGGFLPLPVIDIALVAGVQAKMISEVAKLYGITFKKEAVKGTIAALIGGTLPAVGRQAVMWAGSSALKAIPFAGTILGTVASTFIAGATTRAVGRVYTMHFESGGTLLDFDPAKMRGPFEAAMAEETAPKESVTPEATAAQA
jgi:uncharacterized protein (DUF697 family)